MSSRDLNRQRWRQLIQRFHDSGLSQPDFARRHDLNLSALRYWIYRLRREGLSSPQPTSPPMTFLALTPADTTGPALRLRIDDRLELTFPQHLPPKALTALVASLLEAAACSA